ncbi:hypothetical protein VSDG_05519 [Cytospora chrysosperma]|uniref:Uncharacterized protein n=1 Tax=Cytospora chrysosperma TaxID=252740 RepID=A0A423W026_CYTCH|nr:hypothetical protein VSDG_05519 [Valsa sordida]
MAVVVAVVVVVIVVVSSIAPHAPMAFILSLALALFSCSRIWSYLRDRPLATPIARLLSPISYTGAVIPAIIPLLRSIVMVVADPESGLYPIIIIMSSAYLVAAMLSGAGGALLSGSRDRRAPKPPSRRDPEPADDDLGPGSGQFGLLNMSGTMLADEARPAGGVGVGLGGSGLGDREDAFRRAFFSGMGSGVVGGAVGAGPRSHSGLTERGGGGGIFLAGGGGEKTLWWRMGLLDRDVSALLGTSDICSGLKTLRTFLRVGLSVLSGLSVMLSRSSNPSGLGRPSLLSREPTVLILMPYSSSVGRRGGAAPPFSLGRFAGLSDRISSVGRVGRVLLAVLDLTLPTGVAVLDLLLLPAELTDLSSSVGRLAGARISARVGLDDLVAGLMGLGAQAPPAVGTDDEGVALRLDGADHGPALCLLA